MVKRLFVLAGVLLLGMTGVASAQDYPPQGNDVAVSDGSVEGGQSITVSAQIFQPGTPVSFTLFSAPVVLGTATADANGVATLTATIPAGVAPGTHTIEASGTGANGQPLTVTQSITVADASTGAGSNLPSTGSSSTIPMSRVALAGIAGGGLLVLLANRRRTSAKTSDRETAGV
jgi:hypothetical protein